MFGRSVNKYIETKKKFVGFQGLLKLFCRGVFEHLISCLPTFQSVMKKSLIKDFDLS